MSDRPSPSRHDAALHSHQLLLYDGDEEFLAAALPFARAGIAADEPVFIAAGRHNTALLRRRLGPGPAARADFAGHHFYGTPSQTLLAFRAMAHRTPGRSWVVGETPWYGLDRDKAREWARFETLLTPALTSTGARHLCPYNTRTLPADVLRAAQLAHPQLTTGTRRRPNPAFVDPGNSARPATPSR